MLIINYSRTSILAYNAKAADTFIARLSGLMFRKNFGKFDCLVLRPCNMIHTVGMRFPLDIVFISEDNLVLHAIENIKPCSMSPMIPSAAAVLELPAGTVTSTNTIIGDILSFIS